jgi:hypothetical protein
MDGWNGGSYGALFAAHELAEYAFDSTTLCLSTNGNNMCRAWCRVTQHPRTTDALCGTLNLYGCYREISFQNIIVILHYTNMLANMLYNMFVGG